LIKKGGNETSANILQDGIILCFLSEKGGGINQKTKMRYAAIK
jgi:hypothetical protein